MKPYTGTGNHIVPAECGDPEDHELVADYAWVHSGMFAIYIHRSDEGIVVDVFADGFEMNDPIASTYAYFDDAMDVVNTGLGQA